MDLTSQQDIPVPINATFAPGLHDRHGHVIHHHLHQDHHRLQNPYLDKHEHDPPSPHNNHNEIPQSSAPTAARPTAATQQPPPQQIPSSIIIPSPEILHDQGDDRDDQTPRNSNGNSRKHRHDPRHEEVIIRYRECLKNHAASMGGNSTDGCGEFMPSGQEGTLEALTCSACNCHRNFHRKEVLQPAGTQPSPGAIIMPTPSSRVATSSCFDYHHHPDPRPHPHQMMMVVNNSRAIGGGRKLINMVYPATANANINAKPCRSVPPLMPTYCSSMDGAGGSDDLSDDQHGGGSGLMIGRYRVGGDPPPPPLTGAGMSKKRFRTKFSQEQKERMLNFAESVGWKIQKQEESVVQQFCQEIGVKRRVLKVWMHNNKHNLAKKTVSSAATPPTTA